VGTQGFGDNRAFFVLIVVKYYLFVKCKTVKIFKRMPVIRAIRNYELGIMKRKKTEDRIQKTARERKAGPQCGLF
jgi:hypothetical protein